MSTIEEKISADRLEILRTIARNAIPELAPTPLGEGPDKKEEEFKFEFTFRVVAIADPTTKKVGVYAYFDGLFAFDDRASNQRLYYTLTRDDSPRSLALRALLPHSPMQFSFAELQE